MSILGENIKRLRNEKKLTIRELSKTASVGSSTISEIETGKRQGLNSNTVQKIAIALEVSVEELYNSALNKEYEINDFYEAIEVILDDDEISYNNKLLTSEEKSFLKLSIRKILNDLENIRR